ncbi:hypothetical protein [Thalassococcus sp. S3]|uniref:hypothetical protein n=1 Tax=Thalassococcus sp. S3 TaxID=2017482 RepID=UPI00102D1598|nr:hypothetical protein [Thalassococcus sp. S3]
MAEAIPNTECSSKKVSVTNSQQDKESNMSSDISAAVEKVKDEFDVALAKGSDEIDRISQQTGKFVRDNPGIALAGAAGLGLLVGLILAKRD